MFWFLKREGGINDGRILKLRFWRIFRNFFKILLESLNIFIHYLTIDTPFSTKTSFFFSSTNSIWKKAQTIWLVIPHLKSKLWPKAKHQTLPSYKSNVQGKQHKPLKLKEWRNFFFRNIGREFYIFYEPLCLGEYTVQAWRILKPHPGRCEKKNKKNVPNCSFLRSRRPSWRYGVKLHQNGEIVDLPSPFSSHSGDDLTRKELEFIYKGIQRIATLPLDSRTLVRVGWVIM